MSEVAQRPLALVRRGRQFILADSALTGTVLTNALFMLFTLWAAVLLARLLGPAGRGEFAAIQLGVWLVTSFGHLGIPDAVTFFVGRDRESAPRFFTLGLILVCLTGLVSIAAVSPIMSFLLRTYSADVVSTARLFLWFALVSLLVQAAFATHWGRRQFLLWNVMRLHPVLSVLAGIAFALLKARVSGAVLSARGLALDTLWAGGILGALFLLVAVHSVGLRRPPSTEAVKSLITYAVPSGLAAVPRQLNLRLDHLIIAAALPAKSLGLYAVAASWGYALTPLVWAVGAVAFPRLSAQRGPALKQPVRITVMKGLLTAAVLTGALLIATPLGFGLVFGPSFSEATGVAALLALGGGLSSLNGVMTYCLLGLGRPKRVLAGEAVGVAITVGGLIALVPKLGILGAGLVSVASYGVTACLSGALLTTALSKETAGHFRRERW